jgi:hypothetical protein
MRYNSNSYNIYRDSTKRYNDWAKIFNTVGIWITGLFLFFLGNGVFGQNDVLLRIAVSDKGPAHAVKTTYPTPTEEAHKHFYIGFELDELPFRLDGEEVYCSIILKGKNMGLAQSYPNLKCYESNSLPPLINLPLTHFHEDIPEPDEFKSQLIKLAKGTSNIYVWGGVKGQYNMRFDSLIINFFKPDPSFVPERPIAWAMSRVDARDDDCGCPVPQHVTRQGWGCPDGNNPSCANPVNTQVTHLVVHHSATSNTSANWANTVRSIWNFHTGSNGWCDIGYNWLIDPNGVIYQGRGGGDNIRGAHFCGTNSNTMGICLLGDYRVDTPSAPMMRSLGRLLAWKGCKEQLAVLDTALHTGSNLNLPHVTGHRLGCNTTCPGDEVYNRLSFVRSNTVDSIAACSIISSVDKLFTLQASIFPNPASDHVTLDYDAPLDGIQLFNALGQLVKNISPEKRRISLSGLPPGKYFLRCTKDDAQRSFPFLLP